MSRIPTSIIAGFLGSGKTTLLNGLLRHPDMRGTAVVVNEFGEIGIDNDLVVQSADQVIVLENGCLCCSVKGELTKTLDDLFRRQQRGEIPPFERVIIETTGLADPWPIQRLLTTDVMLKARYSVAKIISTVDAVNWGATREQWSDAVKQITAADCLVVTKSDLVRDDASLTLLRDQLARINPGAHMVSIIEGKCEPDVIFSHEGVYGWLRRHESRTPFTNMRKDVHDGGHLDGIQSHCIVRDEPMPLAALELFMQFLRDSGENRILRVKGLVHSIEQPDRPAVVQAAQDLIHSLTWLGAWPSDDFRTRIVCISKGMPSSELEELFRLAIRMARRTAYASEH